MTVTGGFGDNSAGGGFPDAFAGNQGDMVTQTLQSQNFVSGVSGWQIQRNGNAQFNNGIFRGSVEVVTPSGQDIFIGVIGGVVSEIQFLSGTTYEETPANFAESLSGSGNAQTIDLLISGPQANSPGDDWVQIQLISNNKLGNASLGAEGFLNYIDTSGIAHAFLQWNNSGIQLTEAQVNGLIFSTYSFLGSASNAGATAGAPPSGTATQASSFLAGSPALSYLTALEGTYNTTVGAVNNHATLLNEIIAILNSWL